MIVGGCLSGCGLIAASFCNTVEELYFCVGVIGGKCQLCSDGIATEKPFSEEQLLSSNSQEMLTMNLRKFQFPLCAPARGWPW